MKHTEIQKFTRPSLKTWRNVASRGIGSSAEGSARILKLATSSTKTLQRSLEEQGKKCPSFLICWIAFLVIAQKQWVWNMQLIRVWCRRTQTKSKVFVSIRFYPISLLWLFWINCCKLIAVNSSFLYKHHLSFNFFSNTKE